MKSSRLKDLVEKLDSMVAHRQAVMEQLPPHVVTFQKPKFTGCETPEAARAYVQAYFDNLHAVYPFLNKVEFNKRVSDPNLNSFLAKSPSFSALYHAVLALGCQYHGGSTFDPGNGEAWELFQVSLGLLSDVLAAREPFLSLQV
ncbi:fungal specific transcription, partial [Colletotrichum tofieldiae]